MLKKRKKEEGKKKMVSKRVKSTQNREIIKAKSTQ
jgi:hypothetical protein